MGQHQAADIIRRPSDRGDGRRQRDICAQQYRQFIGPGDEDRRDHAEHRMKPIQRKDGDKSAYSDAQSDFVRGMMLLEHPCQNAYDLLDASLGHFSTACLYSKSFGASDNLNVITAAHERMDPHSIDLQAPQYPDRLAGPADRNIRICLVLEHGRIGRIDLPGLAVIDLGPLLVAGRLPQKTHQKITLEDDVVWEIIDGLKIIQGLLEQSGAGGIVPFGSADQRHPDKEPGTGVDILDKKRLVLQEGIVRPPAALIDRSRLNALLDRKETSARLHADNIIFQGAVIVFLSFKIIPPVEVSIDEQRAFGQDVSPKNPVILPYGRPLPGQSAPCKNNSRNRQKRRDKKPPPGRKQPCHSAGQKITHTYRCDICVPVRGEHCLAGGKQMQCRKGPRQKNTDAEKDVLADRWRQPLNGIRKAQKQ